jgi:FG-GAP-like repeat
MKRPPHSGSRARTRCARGHWLAAIALALVFAVPVEPASAYGIRFGPTHVRKIDTLRYGDVQSVAAGPLLGGDRRADVFVTASRDGRLGRAQVYRVPTVFMHGGGMDIGDVDGDGRADLAVAAYEGIVLYYQRGDGLSRPHRIILDPPDPDVDAYNLVAVEIADVDGDHRRDLTVATSVSGYLVVWNEGHGRFTFTQISRHFGNWFTVGNVAGPRRADIVVMGGIEPPGIVRVLKSHRDRTFTKTDYVPNVPDAGCGGIWSVATGDVTDDGRADVVGPTRGCSEVLEVFPQRSDGLLDSSAWYPLRSQVGETAVVRDMNGNGLKDVVVAHGSHDERPVSRFGVFPQGADSRLNRERMFDLPDTSHYSRTGLAVASVNGDRRPDVLLASRYLGLVYRLHR